MKNTHITLSLLALLAISQPAAAVSKTTVGGLSFLGGASLVSLRETKIFKKFFDNFTKNRRIALGLATTGGFLLLPYKKIILGCGLLGAGAHYFVRSLQQEEAETEAS